MKLLSIIIPIYNVEPYLERCLQSLEDQDIAKELYEIICINDGSPDDSRGVVLRMQKEFNNIILIDQENQGVSRARNNGISTAIGKYLLFIDPDDFVDVNSFGNILKNADLKNAQVSFLGYTVLKENGDINHKIFNDTHAGNIYPGIEAYFLARGDGRTDPDRMWAVLFSRTFIINFNLRYLPDVPYLEDGEFIARILCLADHCIFDGRSFYQRTTRPGSATNSDLFRSTRAIKGFLLAASNLKSFQQDQNLDEKQRRFLNQPICKFTLLTLNSSLKKPYIKNFIGIRKELNHNGFKRLELNGVVKPYIYYAFGYNYFVVAFLFNALLKEIKQILKAVLNRQQVSIRAHAIQ